MDKYKLVLKIIENPELYSPAKLKQLFQDKEIKEIYNLICNTKSSLNISNKLDIEKEWLIFNQNLKVKRRNKFLWFFKWNRIAAAFIIIFTSVVAIAAGIVLSLREFERSKNETSHILKGNNQMTIIPEDSMVAIYQDSSPDQNHIPIYFEDASLKTILDSISNNYKVNILCNDKRIQDLHLFYKLDPSLSLNEIIDQLNTFDQIDIKLKGKTLVIE